MTLAAELEETVTAAPLDEPHHDGSDLYVLERPDELGGTATLRMRVPAAHAADQVILRYVSDGEARTVDAKVDERSGGETWWRATFPVTNPATRYRWLLVGGRAGYAWVNGIGAVPNEVPDADDFGIGAGSSGPDWHIGSVVYEIFVDRFAASGAARTPPSWARPRAWDDLPTGRGPATPREWFGGDLRGIEAHLDHLESLGANLIYLTPFFPAGSTHRYDSTTFEHADPLLGGDAALASLVRAAHARGVRVVGDLTLNHTGVGHEWFRAARADEHAPERGFYYFDGEKYASWLGVPSLPKLDWRSGELRIRMAEVIDRFGLDGWRIDVANMVGRYRDIDLNQAVARWARTRIGDRLLLAEHGHDFRPDLDGTGWHGVMSYAGFTRPAWWWLRRDDWSDDPFGSAPAPRYSGRELVGAMRRFRAGVPWTTTLHSWSLLDSHDTARFRTVTGSRERQLVGVGLQMTTPGVPMLFAGDELGLEGEWGEDARRTMPWDRAETWDEGLLGEYRRLIALRRSSPALARGGIRYVHAVDDAVCFLRETRGERLLCLASRAPHQAVSVPFRTLETLYGEDARDGVLPADGPAFHVWRIHG
jgi:alpha-glucosidase